MSENALLTVSKLVRKMNRYPSNIFYVDDLVEYRGIVWRIREIVPKNKKWRGRFNANDCAVLELETLAIPVITDAKEAAEAVVQHGKNPRTISITSIVDKDKIEYMAMAPINELKLVQLESTPEAFQRLCQYVKDQLCAAGINGYHSNPAHPNSTASYIVADAWRQFDRKKYADKGIEHATRYPPSTIDKKHFSLSAFVKEKERNA